MTEKEFTFAELQQVQGVWSDENFGPGVDSWKMLLGVTEEVGELAHSHLKQVQGIRGNEDHLSMAKDAVGDIIIYLAAYCNARYTESPNDGWDLEEIMRDTWKRVSGRDWVKNPETAYKP